jgi:hypothetical protein
MIIGLTSAESPRVDISSTCKVGQKLGVSVEMFPFGVTIQATVPQWWEIPEGLMNYPVLKCLSKNRAMRLLQDLFGSGWDLV